MEFSAPLILTAVLAAVLAAVLSSLLTLCLLARWMKRTAVPDAEARLERLLASKSEEMGAQIEERVRAGARQGITEGLATLPSAERLADGLQGATETVGRAARHLVGTGLSGLMGGGRKPPENR